VFPFQIDLSKLSYAVAIDILAPFIPGGVVALAWAARHENVWIYLHEDKAIKLVIAVFSIYVVGFVILYLSLFELAAIAFVALLKAESTFEPWKDIEWRKLASAFLGPSLSPPIEVPSQQSNVQPAGNAEELQKFLAQSFSDANLRVSTEGAWRKWYEVLKVYFPPANPYGSPVFTAYVSTLQSIGWAGLIAAWVYGGRLHWAIWLACLVIIAVGQSYAVYNLKFSYNPDPSGYQLSAQLLRQIKNQGPK